MPQVVYILCALTSMACAFLLGRAYRANRVPLLLWSVVCFTTFALTNILLFIDLIVIPEVDLGPLRNGLTLLGVAAILYGLTNQEK